MATAFVVRVAGVPERNPDTHDAGPGPHQAETSQDSSIASSRK